MDAKTIRARARLDVDDLRAVLAQMLADHRSGSKCGELDNFYFSEGLFLR